MFECHRMKHNTNAPWYETNCPDIHFVSMDLYKTYSIQSNLSLGFKPYMILGLIYRIVSNNKDKIGSYRSYATFGMSQDVKNQIQETIEREKRIRACHIIHTFYKKYKYPI